MKYILYCMIGVFMMTCNTHKKTSGTNQEIAKQSQNKRYYAVNFEFTKDAITPISYDTYEGELPLEVFSPTDMFLVIYQGDTLVYFLEFSDPLQSRSLGENEYESSLEKTQQYLTIPAVFSEANVLSTMHMSIYKAKEYVEDFEQIVRSKESLEAQEKETTILKMYTIDPLQLHDFFSK